MRDEIWNQTVACLRAYLRRKEDTELETERLRVLAREEAMRDGHGRNE